MCCCTYRGVSWPPCLEIGINIVGKTMFFFMEKDVSVTSQLTVGLALGVVARAELPQNFSRKGQ